MSIHSDLIGNTSTNLCHGHSWLTRAIRQMLLPAVAILLCGGVSAGGEPEVSPLLAPQSPAMTQTAPNLFKAKFETTKGEFVVEVHREWAPLGADRFYTLVKNSFYDEARFFRVISGFMAQFGVHGEPTVAAVWRKQAINDDPVKESNRRGRVSFAMSGPNTRTTQLFINYGDNSRLDQMGFSPFGQVVEGLDIVDQFYAGYGEGAPQGKGPSQARIQQEGNDYLNREFPRLDYVKKAVIMD